MQRLKRFAALAVTASLALSACGGAATTNSTSAAGTSATTTATSTTTSPRKTAPVVTAPAIGKSAATKMFGADLDALDGVMSGVQKQIAALPSGASSQRRSAAAAPGLTALKNVAAALRGLALAYKPAAPAIDGTVTKFAPVVKDLKAFPTLAGTARFPKRLSADYAKLVATAKAIRRALRT